jgi:hypothetical protein
MELNLKEKIEHVIKDIKHQVREDGTEFVVFTDNTHGLKDLIRECHDGCMPNDWVFDKCSTLLLACSGYDFCDLDDLEEYRFEIVDCAVDIYTNSLLEWAKRFRDYVEEAKKEGFVDGSETIEHQLMSGQNYQLNQMFSILVEGINDLDIDEEEVAS